MELEISYYRDALRSYMTIRCPEEAREEDYRYRMITANQIDGMLPCSLRIIDEKIYLYYEISARQKLSNMFADRLLDGADLRRILTELSEAGTRLSRYLLDGADLLLDPELIYYDFSEDRYYFAFCPGMSDPEKPGDNRRLFVFLAEKIDAADREAALAAFKLDTISEMPGFVFTEKLLKELFGDRLQLPEETLMDPPAPENSGTEDWSGEFFSDKGPEEGAFPPGGAEAEGRVRWERKQEGKSGKTFILRLLPVLVLFAAAGALGLAGRFCALPVRILRLFTALALAAGGGGLLALAYLLIRRFLPEKAPADPEGERPVMTRVPESEYDFWKGEEPEDRGPAETAYVSGISGMDGLRLYGSGRAKGISINMEDLPHTIGTAAGFADVLLSDDSVSRMHARITEDKGGDPVLTDLNSTNGTWVNGIRLQPEESIRIGKGDMIRFGEAEFCCR